MDNREGRVVGTDEGEGREEEQREGALDAGEEEGGVAVEEVDFALDDEDGAVEDGRV